MLRRSSPLLAVLASCASGARAPSNVPTGHDAPEAISVSWHTAPSAGRDVDVAIVVDGRAHPVGRLRADGEQLGSPKTCTLRGSRQSTATALMCGYSLAFNYFEADLIAGELVVTLHTGYDSEGEGPIENAPVEMMRIPLHASKLAVAPYEQTFAEALQIFCDAELLGGYDLVSEDRSIAISATVEGLVSNVRALDLFRTLSAMEPALKRTRLRAALAEASIPRCAVIDDTR
jgi:hypothetical protein